MPSQALREQIIAAFKPFNPRKIILFGSRARGDGDSASDVDLIVVYDTPKRFMDRLKELYMAWEGHKGADILAYTPSEFYGMLADNAFIQQAVSEGALIYEGT